MPTIKKTTSAPRAPRKTTAAKTQAPKIAAPARERKPRAHKEAPPAPETAEKLTTTVVAPQAEVALAEGKYAYAVGRRKTSVANVRLFSGKEKSLVNKKEIEKYFNNQALINEAFRPLQLTGLENQVYVYVNVSGGGSHSQSQAVAHGIALALAKNNPEFRKVLKKNGTLTRDSRMKERKKPGLKRARRGPQWAKR